MASSAIVIDSNSPVQGREHLKFCLQNILKGVAWDNNLDPLLDTLEQQPQAMQSVSHLSSALKQILIENIRVQNNNPLLDELLAAVLYHQKEMRDNLTCYTHIGKLEPDAFRWPNPTKEARSILTELPFARRIPFVSKHTVIGSAGSCFAMEVAKYLKSHAYHYLVTEVNPYSCAAWGTIFNTAAFRLLIERAFGVRQTPKLLWRVEKEGQILFRDPFREEITFSSPEEYMQDYDKHLAAARQALEEVDVFIITLGLNEVWSLRSDPHIVLSRNPWNISPGLVERRVLSARDNLAELQKMLDIWRIYNPKVKIIVSVSPVPMMATFQGENKHVAEASCYSKSTLRVAAEEFAQKNSDVYYFPSYETVLYCTPDPFEADQRHVKSSTVARVMSLFQKMFVVETEQRNSELNDLPQADLTIAWCVPFQSTRAQLEPLLRSYLQTFQEQDAVTLQMLIDSTEMDDIEAFQLKVATWLQEWGYDPEHIPEILIADNTSSNWHDIGRYTLYLSFKNAVEPVGVHFSEALFPLCYERLKEYATVISFIQKLPAPARVPATIFQAYQQQLLTGYTQYLTTGKTSQQAYEALRAVTCLSQGQINQGYRSVIAQIKPRHTYPLSSSYWQISDTGITAALSQLNEDGYYVFPQRLALDDIAALETFARNNPARPRPLPEGAPERVIPFAPDAVQAMSYWFYEHESPLLTIPPVQKLLTDPLVLHLVQSYLGCAPIMDIVTMWWSHALPHVEPSSLLAQLYHMDMDRFNFIKLFIYVTDVDETNGPHAFVRKSHRHKPGSLWRDGRIPDDEVLAAVDPNHEIHFTGAAGTVFLADTLALHKGILPKDKDRLLFQFCFTNSLFGAPYATEHAEPMSDLLQQPHLNELYQRAPELFARYQPWWGNRNEMC